MKKINLNLHNQNSNNLNTKYKLLFLLLFYLIFNIILNFPISLCDSNTEDINENKILGSIVFITFIIIWLYGINGLDIMLNLPDNIDVTDLYIAEPKPLKAFGKEALDVPIEKIVKDTVEIINSESKK